MKLAKYIFTFLIFFNSLLICQELQYNVLKLDSLGTLKNLKVLDNGEIYLSSDNGLYKSTNEGTSWKQLVSGGVLSFDINKDKVIITSESNQDTIGITTNEIVMRKEIGDSLQVIDRYLLDEGHNDFLNYLSYANLIKTYNNSIYAAIDQGSRYNSDAAIITSDSVSNTWVNIFQASANGGSTRYPNGHVFDILPLSKDTVMISMYYSVQTVNITYDLGKNWQYLGGYDNEHGFKSYILSIALTADTTIVYASQSNGIFRSTNFGSSWSNTFKKSEVFKLLINGYPSKIFAFTADSVYLSLNEGLTWTSIPSNKKFANLKDAYINTNGAIYLISDSSLYVPQNVIDDITNEESSLPVAFKLMQNFPNPFNPTTIINYSIPKESFVTIKVYDILGREVTTLVNEEKNAGEYSVKFNGSKLASGVYLYRMQAGNFIQTKKLVLIK